MVHCKEAIQDNKPIRIVSLYDLTEQEVLKQKLSKSEEKYRELYRSARACLFRTRISDGRLLDCSRATTRLFGYANEAEAKNGFSVTDTYVNPQQRKDLIETLKKERRVKTVPPSGSHCRRRFSLRRTSSKERCRISRSLKS
jgi:PAS domain-containing protein